MRDFQQEPYLALRPTTRAPNSRRKDAGRPSA